MWFTEASRRRPLAAGNPTNGRMDRHDIVCVHTMVGYLTSTERMFRVNGYTGVESHFGIGGIWGGDLAAELDGVAFQFVSTEFRADANLDGTHRIVSIETADNAPAKASGILPWTPKQCRKLIELIAAICKRYDIPAELVPDSRPGRRGIAYHRQGIDPWRVAGGEIWSKSRGKECPGDARIAQLKSVIIPGVRAILAGKPTTEQKDDEMSKGFDDDHTLTDADAAAYGSGTKKGDKKSYDEIVRFPPATARLRREMTAQIGALTGLVTQILEAVKDGGGLTPEQAKAAAEAGARAALGELKDALPDGE
jgi:hypothetical protein